MLSTVHLARRVRTRLVVLATKQSKDMLYTVSVSVVEAARDKSRKALFSVNQLHRVFRNLNSKDHIRALLKNVWVKSVEISGYSTATG